MGVGDRAMVKPGKRCGKKAVLERPFEFRTGKAIILQRRKALGMKEEVFRTEKKE